MHKTSVKIIVLILFLNLYSSNTFSQEKKSVLIYANKTDFLLPYIKVTLENMVDNQSGKNLILKATNLNLLFANTTADKLLRLDLDHNFPNKSFSSFTKSTLKDSSLNVFLKNDYFLLVNENTLQDKIEFQLVLYKILKNNDKEIDELGFPTKDLISPIAENNFFIDLKSSNYLSVLRNGVKKLFPNSNFLPKFKIIATGNINRIEDTKFISCVNEEITLGLLKIYDEDNSIQEIKFDIRIIPDNILIETPHFNFDEVKKEFKISFESLGKYKILISGNDGISTAYSDTLSIEILPKYEIYLLKNKINVAFVANMFSEKIGLTSVVPIIIPIPDTNYIVETEVISIKKSEKQNIRDTISNHYKHKNKYGTNLKLIKKRYYELKFKGIENIQENSMNVFAVKNGLKSNIENINLNVVGLYPFIINSEFESNYLRFIKNDTSIAVFNYNVINYLGFNLKILTVDKLSLGIKISIGNTIAPILINGKIRGLKGIDGQTQNINVFISKPFIKKDIIFDLSFGFLAKKIPLTFDTSKIYNPINYYYTLGGELNLHIIPINLYGFGFLSGINLSSSKYYGLIHKNFAIKVGLLYNPIYKNKK